MEMKIKRKKNIKYPKERAVLSDVLPYEIPITFSNRHLYNFLIDNNIKIENNKITYSNKLSGNDLDAFKILMDISFYENNPNDFNSNFKKIPFTFKISHKENDFRELAVIHPINQLKLIDFYNQYKELIIYYCSLSNFSIRFPDNIAKFTFYNDQLHQTNKGDSSDFLELSGKEYENLKTFFSYRKYTNIYRFYEDYRYQRAEKKYNYLYKFDIAKCFDSIYTHSIVWAVLGFDTVKENIRNSKNTFAGFFDTFMQYSNYGETNGILIGPEFSRIFAEIILQRIDKTLELKLKKKGYILKKHYELYRYVDDYFLFCDDEILKENTLIILKHILKKYKFSINDAKYKEYKKPIITDISIAKNKIIKLFSEEPRFIISKISSAEMEEDAEKDNSSLINHKFTLHFDSNTLATKYKIIIKESHIDYNDVLNYSLAILDRKLEDNLKKFEKIINEYLILELNRKLSKHDIYKIRKIEDSLSFHIINFIDFVIFIYSVSPCVSPTIKVSLILSKIIKFYKGKFKLDDGRYIYKYSENNRERVFKKILDEASFILNKNTLNEYAQVESLYLLTVLRDLGKQYRLSESLLSKFLNTYKNNGSLIVKKDTLNYFSIVVSFFYIGYSHKYPNLKSAIIDYTFNYISSYPIEKRTKSAEITYLMLDLFACPFLDPKFKIKLLILYRGAKTYSDAKKTIFDVRKIITYHKKHKYWFTKWEMFNLAKELKYKKSQEVYS